MSVIELTGIPGAANAAALGDLGRRFFCTVITTGTIVELAPVALTIAAPPGGFAIGVLLGLAPALPQT